MSARKAGLIGLNLLILGIFAFEVDDHWGWSHLLTPWRTVPLAWLILATFAQILSYALRALRIYLAERQVPRGAYLICLRLILINNSLNLLLPMRSGEASFPILMKRWFGIGISHAAGTLLWLRLLDLHVLASIGLLCVGTGWIGSLTASALLAAAAMAAMLAPVAAFLARKPLGDWLARHPGKSWQIAAQVLAGLPSHQSGLGLDLMLTWSAWSVKLLALGWLLAHLAGNTLIDGVIGAIGGDLATVMPIYTPGGFGIYEAGVIAALSAKGAPSAALLAGAVNLHLFVLTVALIGGALAWIGRGRARPAAQAAKLVKLS